MRVLRVQGAKFGAGSSQRVTQGLVMYFSL